MDTDQSENHFPVNLLLAVAVAFTVVLALLLAQLDSLTNGARPTPEPVAQSTLQPVTRPALPIVVLPSSTVPVTAVAGTPALTPQATAVSIIPDCTIPPGWLPYEIQPGDTLYTLSVRAGISADAIVQANCLTMTNLTSGSVIYLPAAPPSPPPPCGPPAHWVRYTVQYGDTLYSLAQRTGSTVYAIMQANCMSATTIYAGQTLYLPFHPTPPVVPTMPPQPSATPEPTLPPTAVPTNTETPAATNTPDSTPPAGTPPPPTPTTTATVTVTAPPSPSPTMGPSLTPTATPTGQLPTATPSITPTFTPPTATATIPGYPPPPTQQATPPPYP